MTVKHDPLEQFQSFEHDLYYLLTKHFGNKWDHTWDAEEEGFYLRLTVWDQPFMWKEANEDD